MTVQRYSVNPQAIDTLLTWIKTKDIVVPEIQRPFVWTAIKVRNFLDSLYKGFPVGYLILWRNPNIRTKSGELSSGKKILIDGQQRIVSLIAALLGEDVINKDYEHVRIRIAFNPVKEEFEVTNPAISKNPVWVPDISILFTPEASIIKIVQDYLQLNPELDQLMIEQRFTKLQKILTIKSE